MAFDAHLPVGEKAGHSGGGAVGGVAQSSDGAPVRPTWSGLLTAEDAFDAPYTLRRLGTKITRTPVTNLPSLESKQPPNTLRLVCISDTHNAHGSIPILPPGDVLVHAGDFTDVGLPQDIDAFCGWLAKQTQFQHKVVIAGNHDLSLDAESYADAWKRFGHKQMHPVQEQIAKLKSVCHYLHDSAIDIQGIRFYGSPYQPRFYDWAFNLDRGNVIRSKWAQIPTDVDVLITHGPPLGHGDRCSHGGNEGCIELLDWVEKFAPKVHVFGHIHEGYGVTTNGRTTFVNASTLNLAYDVRKPNPPVIIDLPLGQQRQQQ